MNCTNEKDALMLTVVALSVTFSRAFTVMKTLEKSSFYSYFQCLHTHFKECKVMKNCLRRTEKSWKSELRLK